MNAHLVTNYSTFAAWHDANYEGRYNVPTLEQVMGDISLFGARTYDATKDLWFSFAGKFHETPGLRLEFTWQMVAERYEGMYSDFSAYGTN